MTTRSLFFLAFPFFLAACSESAEDKLTEACVSGTNIDRAICECCSVKANESLSPLAVEFLTATLNKDDAKTDELRGQLTLQDLMEAGMFMVGTPAECVSEMSAQE